MPKASLEVLAGDYGLGMDALVSVCSWNTNGIMIGALMLWSASALGTRPEFSCGHGCSVSVCSWNTNGIMVLRAVRGTLCSL